MSAAKQIRKMLRYDYAVYWPPAGFNDEGMPNYGTAEEINVRWEDLDEIALSKERVEFEATAKVYVDRELALHGMLWHGRKDDLPFQTPHPDALEIRKRQAMPDKKNRAMLRWIYV